MLLVNINKGLKEEYSMTFQFSRVQQIAHTDRLRACWRMRVRFQTKRPGSELYWRQWGRQPHTLDICILYFDSHVL